MIDILIQDSKCAIFKRKNKSMRKFLLIALVFCSTTTCAQSPQDIIKQIFTTYQTNPSKAVLDIHETNEINKNRVQSVVNIKNLVASFEQSMGEYYGFELIESEKISASLEKHLYLIKYQNHPLIFGFVMYKPNDKWLLYSFDIDDSIINGDK